MTVDRHPEPVQKPFLRIALKKEVEGLLSVAGEVIQARADGGRNVARLPIHALRASR